MTHRLWLTVAIAAAIATPAHATEYPPTSVTPSSALAGWPATSAIDGNAATIWSSNVHPDGAHAEWIALWHSGFQDVNYVRLTPRFSGRALGFPKTFSISWSDGSSWQLARTVTAMQTPYRNDDIVLALPATVHTNGIMISASVLGDDGVGNYVLQLADVRAGFDAALQAVVWAGNDGSANRITVRNAGSRAFDPGKLRNWNFDARNPILPPAAGAGYRNIYAPSVVRNGGAWNVFFGGWDNSPTPNDEVSVAVTLDNFATFNPHAKVISHGAFVHVNNESAIKLGANQWQMAYTTYAAGGLNKPGYATSSDGVSFTPSTGSSSYLMTMTGYPGWAAADVNGGNAIYFDGAQYHMYWIDFANGFAMNYATSPNNHSYTFQGTKFTGYVPQDIKAFDYAGTRYYLSAYHNNGASAYVSLNTTLTSPATPAVAFSHSGAGDDYITSVGLVSDGARLYGALYGASSVSSLDHNQIFAAWLQRKLTFQSAATYLAAAQASGPDTVYVAMVAGQGVETGALTAYDSDGTTLLRQVPKVTVLAGDIWNLNF